MIKRDYNKIYNEVLELVIAGNTIEKSCKIIGVLRESLYKNINDNQKLELKQYKTTSRNMVANLYSYKSRKKQYYEKSVFIENIVSEYD